MKAKINYICKITKKECQNCREDCPYKENAAKLTWTGKIIYLGDGFYAMVPINRPESNIGRNHFPAWLTRLFGRRRSYGY